MLAAAERTRMRAYVVLSLLTGARTEELRALTWDHVDLTGEPGADPPVPPHMTVWRSVRAGGGHQDPQVAANPRAAAPLCRGAGRPPPTAGPRPDGSRARRRVHGLVFASRVGTPLDAADVRREFRRAIQHAAGLDAGNGHPGSYATASCHCSPTVACRWKRSHAWWAIAAPP